MEEAVTRGVRVRATTLYAPEASRSNSLVFTYRYAERLPNLSLTCAPGLAPWLLFVLRGDVKPQTPQSTVSCSCPCTPPTRVINSQNPLPGLLPRCCLPEADECITCPLPTCISGMSLTLCACSIRFSLLPEERQAEHWPATAGAFYPLTSCQLISRHWIIRDAAGRQTDEVHGKGHMVWGPGAAPGRSSRLQ
jgi:uncharacterized protein affecting Mg2+/Co2+ transport